MGSIQAKQHHSRKGVNAQLSLKRPPRTGVPQLVVNLHWTTANVNMIVDSNHNLSHSLVISKDIIPGDIAPVQQTGHSWSSRLEYYDHTWDQSRTNSITPITFLFLETVTTVESIIQLTRTGQAVTLLNLSFYEAETCFKCKNEIFYLLTLPELYDYFRDKNTGKLDGMDTCGRQWPC